MMEYMISDIFCVQCQNYRCEHDDEQRLVFLREIISKDMEDFAIFWTIARRFMNKVKPHQLVFLGLIGVLKMKETIISLK